MKNTTERIICSIGRSQGNDINRILAIAAKTDYVGCYMPSLN